MMLPGFFVVYDFTDFGSDYTDWVGRCTCYVVRFR
jgi:hypothetical protein